MSSEDISQTADGAAAESEAPRVLTDPKAMRALAHPVRMGLLDLFGVHETLTATQASELLGESPANCAFHLRTLAKYGFVREAGGGRGRERPWVAVSRRITVTERQDNPQAAVAAVALGQIYLERWLDRARQLFGSVSAPPGWEHAAGWSRLAVYLTADEASELMAEMLRLLRRYEGRRADPAQRPAGALPVEWALFAAPAGDLGEPASPEPGPGRPPGTRDNVK